MMPRTVTRLVQSRLAEYPSVAIVGPRQCGKTTVGKALSQNYFDLEQESDRLRLDLAWNDLSSSEQLIVLDEAQSWPELFPRLRGEIDQNRSLRGRYLLLGSISPALMHQVTQSLAGRLALVEMSPLNQIELTSDQQRDRHWFFGGYFDGGVCNDSDLLDWQSNYIRLLAYRDLPEWGLSARPSTTLRLMKMLAYRNGQIWNASELGKSLSLSYHTVNSYVDYLEGAYLLRRLPAYHKNIGKRLVKSPKLYWRDSGLLHSLLGIDNTEHLFSYPSVGQSWEAHVIEQLLSSLTNLGRSFDAFHVRFANGREIDLLVQFNSRLWAIEIKLTTNPTVDEFRLAVENSEMLGATNTLLICRTTNIVANKTSAVCDLATATRFLLEGSVS
ncbi:MAG: ATP-binding protein [Gammaproteobacteria bacterium]|nr:ATP-binding protein [Gammaproteobacteria bacterium]